MATTKRPDSAFGKTLRAALEAKGHKQTWLAAKAGFRREQLNVWMKKEGLPPGDALAKIAGVLQIPVDALTGGNYPDRSLADAPFNDKERAAMNDPRGRAILSLMGSFSERQLRRLLKVATEIEQQPDAPDTPVKEAVHRGPPR